MRFSDYEREFHLRYAEFAQTVKQIIEKAIAAAGVPRPQSIQSRAKTAASLKARLEENGKLDSETVEQERKDLAGARLIFYTNTDADRFLSSHLLFDNFDVEREFDAHSSSYGRE